MGLKRAARWTAAASGMFGVSRILSGRWPRILMYHDFCGPNDNRPGCTGVETFRQHLVYLARYYHPLRLRELGSALTAGRAGPLSGHLSRRRISELPSVGVSPSYKSFVFPPPCSSSRASLTLETSSGRIS